MKPKYKIYLIKLYAILFGAFCGLFIGLIIIGTIFRIAISFIFQWGDSGAEWANWIIKIITILSIMGGIYISIRWANYYLRKRGFLKEDR